MLGSILVGFLVGLLAAAITNRGERIGCIGKTLLGLIGSSLGQFLFGNWDRCYTIPLLFHRSLEP